MTTTMTRWRQGALVPFDFGSLFPFLLPEIRIEQMFEEGRYVVRAEIPGVDPEKDLDITVMNGLLKIHMQRTEEKHERAHSEFRYGQFERTVALPPEALEETATAKYTNGILEVSVELGEAGATGRHLPIKVEKEKGGKPVK